MCFMSIQSFTFKTEQACTKSFFSPRKFHLNFILQFLAGIVIHCLTLLDPVYLHNSNAILEDINIVTVFKHTF